MKKAALLCATLLGFCAAANAQTPTPQSGNLIPNGTFTAANPLEGWRIDFPYEQWYAKNKDYVTATSENAKPGSKCAQISLPPRIAGNEGGKIESAFIKIQPGATYRAGIDCLTWDFSAKLFVEVWVTDPKPISNNDKLRVPARDGHAALAMVYRAPFPDPHSKSKKWETVTREFKIPATVRVAGEDMPPEFLSLKAYTYEGTLEAGKSYFGNFRLTKIKDPQ